jgi:hypothetical protein
MILEVLMLCHVIEVLLCKNGSKVHKKEYAEKGEFETRSILTHLGQTGQEFWETVYIGIYLF